MNAIGATLAPGTLFAGDFEVQHALSTDGQVSVYAVRQRSTGGARALRVLPPDALAEDSLRQRFVRDAMAGASVESDHVVKVYAAGVEAASRQPWVCTELLQGTDLASTVARRGALPPREVAELLRQLGHALTAAHRAGVVHQDLRPEKVFLAESRSVGASFTVKVLDFGMAELLQKTLSSATAAEAMSAPRWIAPEQTELGAAARPSADVFALGLLAFWMLTGHSYWRAANQPGAAHAALLRELLSTLRPSASERAAELGVTGRIPPGFDECFARCVARDPAARFPEAGSATAALLATIEGSSPPAPSARPLAPTVAAGMPAVPLLSGTERLPRAFVEQAVAMQSATPTVLGAAPPPRAPAPPAPPKRARWPWVVAAAVALAVGGVELALLLSAEPAHEGPAATIDGGIVVPIPVVGPRFDAAVAPWPTITPASADVPAGTTRSSRRARDDDGGAESPWFYDVPMPFDAGGAHAPLDAPPTPPPRDVPTTPTPHDAEHHTHTIPAHDAGHGTHTAPAHDAGHGTHTAPAHDAGHGGHATTTRDP